MTRVWILRWFVPLLVILSLLVPGLGRAQTAVVLSPDLVACLRAELGTEFAAVSQQQRPPTAAEKAAGQRCFEAFGPTVIDETPAPMSFSSELTACLEEQFGASRFQVLKSGTAGEPTAAEKAKAETCFAQFGKPDIPAPERAARSSPSGGSAGPAGMPAGLVGCLKAALGETVFSQISADRRSPSATERQQGETCFARYRDQVNFSPPAGSASATAASPVITEAQQRCLQTVLGSDFDRATIGVSIDEGQRRVAAEKCFGERVSSAEPTVRPSLSPETDRCMVQAFGDELATAMRDGMYRGGSEAAIVVGKERMAACLGQVYGSTSASVGSARLSYPTPAVSPADAVSIPSGVYAVCLERTLADRYQQFLAGQYQPMALEWQVIKDCMTAANPAPTPSYSTWTVPSPSPSTSWPAPTASPSASTSPSPSPSSSVDARTACLQAALGVNYSVYQQGAYTPSPAEVANLQSCPSS